MKALRTIMYRTNSGAKPGLAVEGRKKIHVVLIEATGVTVVRVDKSESRYMSDLDMPMKKAVRGFRRAGKNLGMTKAARALLEVR